MNILSKDFNTKSLLKYVFPTILMMIFMSTYSIVDGLFVANLVGEDGLAAINMVWPAFNVVLAIGLMFSTGGTAVMGKLMGEGKAHEARSFLSLIYLVALILGATLTICFLTFPDEIITLLGVKDDLYPYAMDYFIALGFFTTPFFYKCLCNPFSYLLGNQC